MAQRGSTKRRRRREAPRYTAATADKYELYQRAVQSPEVDVAFLARIFRRERGRDALHLREDFCGTGLVSAHWVRQGERHTAEGFDIDPDPVAWGLAHNVDGGARGEPDAHERLALHLKDVREPGARAYDLRIALNFSYWVFKTRSELVEYFRAARESLVRDGVFVVDLYGGPDATEPMEETRRCRGFTYVWKQREFFPGTADYACDIVFRFRDRSEMTAFRYRWRLWSLTELRDALYDAGFARVDSYFEGTNSRGGGDGNFRRGVRGENCAAWLAYLAALK
jgi:SAM-dependent methyltransferase